MERLILNNPNKFPEFHRPFKDGEMIRASIGGWVYKMTPMQWAAYIQCYRKGGIMSGATLNNVKKIYLDGHPFIFPLSRKEILAQPFMFPQEYLTFVNSRPLTFKFYLIADMNFAKNFLKKAERESVFLERWHRKMVKNAKNAAKILKKKRDKEKRKMLKNNKNAKKFTFL